MLHYGPEISSYIQKHELEISGEKVNQANQKVRMILQEIESSYDNTKLIEKMIESMHRYGMKGLTIKDRLEIYQYRIRQRARNFFERISKKRVELLEESNEDSAFRNRKDTFIESIRPKEEKSQKLDFQATLEQMLDEQGGRDDEDIR